MQERLKAFNVLRKCLETDSYIVTEIRNSEGELINPKDRLFEHAGPSGLIVSATVATSFPVDDWENPEINDWMQSAYVKSSSGIHWTGEIEAWRHSLRQIKQANQGSKDVDYNATLLAQKVLPNTSRLIKIGLDFDESDLESLFRLDWEAVGLQHLRALSEADKRKVGKVLQARYHLVCNVFAHYAGIGKGALCGASCAYCLHDYIYLHLIAYHECFICSGAAVWLDAGGAGPPSALYAACQLEGGGGSNR
ncbi:hypothetical protein EON64_15200 [archaeon]|nr:MAG: hypothetical protein EON64_15200 [archaeon]